MSDEIVETPAIETPAAETTAPAPTMADTMDRIAADIAAREPVRGEGGRFQPKVVAEGTAPEGTEVPGKPELAAPEPVQPAIAAPQSLPDDVKKVWSTLPLAVQETWAKRESETTQKITTDGQRLKDLSAYEEVLTPFSERLKQVGAPPAEYVRRLAHADDLLHNNFEQGIQEIYRMYGRDPRAALQPGQQPDPSSALTRELTELRSQVTALTTNAEQAKLGAAQQVIDDFKKDKPHFDAVMPLMTTLMEGKAAKTLDEAYAMATKAHPEVSTKVAAEAKAKADAEAVEAAKLKAAKDARLSSFGKRPGSTPTAPVKGKNIWDTMDRVAAEVRERT